MLLNSEYLSPDGRYLLILSAYEMRMSHWVENPSLQDCQTKQDLFQAPTLWSAERVTWSPESDFVQLSLRVYPGRKPSVTVWLYPTSGQAKAMPETLSTSPDPDHLVEGSIADIERYLKEYGG